MVDARRVAKQQPAVCDERAEALKAIRGPIAKLLPGDSPPAMTTVPVPQRLKSPAAHNKRHSQIVVIAARTQATIANRGFTSWQPVAAAAV
jgi:hypothetical protein